MTNPVLAPSESIPKLQAWERKLLDLGLRNNLINLSLSRTVIPLLVPSVDKLEDALFLGTDFSLLPKEDGLLSECEVSFETMHTLLAEGERPEKAFSSGKIYSPLTENELSKNMKELFRASRLSIEENGANSLYIALGLVRWFEADKKDKARYAPIILVPVEILRKGAKETYIVRMRDDEARVNITMLEKFKQDLGISVEGLDPIPTDENGIDTAGVFSKIADSVSGIKDFGVLPSAYLGIFSFSQFVMWNDIKNRSDDLLKNKIVRSLADGKLSWDAIPMETGEKVGEDNVLLPMSADASQLFAIESACRGESFVLHGPPGTGKSQTITTLIANALANGKTVLFAAEKMAALEVVQKRLDNIGIGAFCLELHSNKAKKKDVLEQLRIASEITKTTPPSEYEKEAAKIAEMRFELDSYASKLHEKRACGRTLSELINQYEAYKGADDIPVFDRNYSKDLDKDALYSHSVILERLVASGKAIGHPQDHPLSLVGAIEYTQDIKPKLPDVISEYRSALCEIKESADACAEYCGWEGLKTFSDLSELYLTASELIKWAYLPIGFASADNPSAFFAELSEMCGAYIRADEKKASLLSEWNDGFTEEDGKKLLAEYSENAGKWFLAKSLSMNKLHKRLSAYSKSPKELSDEKIKGAIDGLCAYQKELLTADTLFEKYKNSLGELVNGSMTDWESVSGKVSIAKNSFSALSELCGDDMQYKNLCAGTHDQEIRKALEDFAAKYGVLCEKKQACEKLFGLKDLAAKENILDESIAACDSICANADGIKDVITFNGIAHEAEAFGLSPVVEYYLSGASHDNVVPAYHKSMLTSLIMAAIDESTVLGNFSGSVFNQKIEQYKNLDKTMTELARKEIFLRLASQLPDFTADASKNSEIGILCRAIKSGGRGISIRSLFEQLPNLISRLCPCMLMSPISAAQYLDPKRAPFDIVVFDEASQLQTCKAVGVLARGKEAIIVGDPKQMPPTSFFSVNNFDEDDPEIEDLESILDDCLALSMPQTHLLWHYRSRHESLISFSNEKFYENKLYTFPSVNDRESKVTYKKVDGIFDRGKTRTNKAEAEEIIEEIKKRYADPDASKMSIGVVTFNISQQNLIEDLLSEACAADEEFEKWIYHRDEPIFIKNLENVQGDERDVILFSVGYGPDSEGCVSMNFGPLNRDGGWRRLNVAVTRARCEMKVFSSLTPEMIDVKKTSSEGVAALRDFLSFAKGREISHTHSGNAADEDHSDGIARSICEKLHEAGYETEFSVGHSAYKIDIGVIDPAHPEKYILGILLDGESYGRSKTTRDREIAEISVLCGLSWNITRVWALDWWDNSEKEISRIISIIKSLEEKENGENIPQSE